MKAAKPLSVSIRAIDNCSKSLRMFGRACGKFKMSIKIDPYNSWKLRNGLFLNGNRPPRGKRFRSSK